MKLRLRVNGIDHELELDPLRRLLDVLRDDLGLVGTKEGCGEGECGACTVLIGDEPVNSCLVPACHADRRRVTTVEALAQDAICGQFAAHGASQCGICTPGMIVMTKAWLARCAERGEDPTEAGARAALAGNLCRCTGYGAIVAAALAAGRGVDA